MGQKHVAKSGASAGQWVTCKAQKQCPNGGEHISADTLKTVSEKTYTRIKDLTESDVLNYLGKTPAPSSKPVKTENNLTVAAAEAEKHQVKVPQYKSHHEYTNMLIEKLNAHLESKNLLREGETVVGYSSNELTDIEYFRLQGFITRPEEELDLYDDDATDEDYNTVYHMNIDFKLSSGRIVSTQGPIHEYTRLLKVKL